MKIIGLTGQSGAGKGYVASCLEEKGVVHIDCDRVYHELLIPPSECLDEIVRHFGKAILFPDGTLNRSALASLVFRGEGHKEKLAALNLISHKFVIKRCDELIEECRKNGESAVLLDAPTLIESGLYRECDFVLAVTAPQTERLSRIIKRDGITREKALERLESQPPENFYTEKADFVISNSGDGAALQAQIAEFIAKIQKGV